LFTTARKILRAGISYVLACVLLLQMLPAPTQAAGGNLQWPLSPAASSFKSAIESDFGFRNVTTGTRYHFAVDTSASKGTAVNAVAAGEVTFAGCNNPSRAVVVYHASLGIATVYMHLSSISVSVGDTVNAGSKIGESGPDDTSVFGYHLDLRVVKGRLPAGWTTIKDKNGNVTGYSCPVGSASQYDNPTRWFSSLDTGASDIPESMKVREGTSGGYKDAETLYETDSSGNKYVPIDENDIWVRLKVSSDDKDLDTVKAVLKLKDGGEVELHNFDYYMGDSHTNTSMPIRVGATANTATDKGYVSNQGTSSGNPAKDLFFARVKKEDVPTDGKIHKVAFHVKDAFANESDITKTEVPVKRKGTYMIKIKPDQDEYTCCAAPTFTVEVRSAEEEGNPLVDINADKETIEGQFMGEPATLTHTGKGTYRATTSEQMRNAGSYVLSVKIKRKSDGKNLGTGAGAAKAKLPPQEYYTDNCGHQRPKVWDSKLCQWVIPPGNTPCQPDDNAGFAFEDPTAGGESGGAAIAVMAGGFSDAMAAMLQGAGVKVDVVPADFSPTIAAQYRALFVSSGGFSGLGQSPLMAERLAQYTEAGGTLVVFTQPQGKDFGLLPGGEVEGYGYDEDLFCVFKSTAISAFGPQLTGQPEELLSLNVDGYFTHLPTGSTVLLRRTLTGMPAMFTYAHGNGRVLATTTYADMAAQLGQGTPSEVALMRDLAVWALNPELTVPRTRLGGTVNVDAHLTNPTPIPAVEADFDLIGPDGATYDSFARPVAIPAGGDSTLTLPMAVPVAIEGGDTLPLGLWRLEARLFDADGNELAAIPAAAEYGVAAFEETPGGFAYQGQPYSLTVTSESEEYLKGESANFTFHVFNNADTTRTFKVSWGLPHHGLGWDQTLWQEITVPAHDQGQFTYTLPQVRDLDRLRGILWLNGAAVARVERGFWMKYPQASVSLTPAKQNYAANETPSLTLTALNGISREYSLTGTLKLTDSTGTEQATIPVQFLLPSRGTYQAAIPLTGPLPYGSYRATVQLSALGSFVGQPTTAFSVPLPKLQVGLNLPTSPGAQVPLGIRVENQGPVNLPSAQLHATLTNPSGTEVWSADQNLGSIANGAAQNLSFQMERGPLTLGDYRLAWEVTTAGQALVKGDKVLPASLESELAWDKPSYRVRDVAKATATVRNTGYWQLNPTVSLTLPDAGFAADTSADIAAGASQTQQFDVPLPVALPAGSHVATLTARVNAGGKQVERSLPLTVPNSQVTVTLGATQLQAGEALDLHLNNPGGVDTTAAVTAAITDSAGKTVAETSPTPSLMAGGSAAIALALPAGAANGAYVLSVTGQNQGTSTPFAFFQNLQVNGVAGTVSVQTDHDSYLHDQAVTVLGDVGVTNGSLANGNLNLAIYATSPPSGSCSSSTSAASSVAAAPAEDREKALLGQAYYQSLPDDGTLRATATGGWVGSGPAISNPWYHYYPYMYNEYMDVTVEGGGRFTVGTMKGDPDSTLDDYKKLLYGHPSPWSSFTTFRVNGSDVLLGSGGQWTDPPHFDATAKGLVGTWVYGSLRVRQTLTLVQANGNPAIVRINYQVENTGTTTQQVGTRVMLDTQLGYNDGAPFRVLGQGNITTETEFLGAAVPDNFIVVDSLQSPQIAAQGIVSTAGERTPDRLVFANWYRLYSTAWNFTVQPGYSLTGDSGVGYYWNPVALAPGETMELSTRYGATSVGFGSGQISTVVTAPAQLCSPADNPFWVQAFVRNNTWAVAQNVRATLNLPTGLTLAPNQQPTYNVGSLNPGSEAQASWLVRATGEVTGPISYSVTSAADNAGGSTANRSVDVSPNVFQTGDAVKVWEQNLPVTTNGLWPYSKLAQAFSPGKYIAVATLTAPTGQVLGTARYPFFVAADQTLLTMQTDKEIYRVGDTVSLSGKVKNLTSVAGTFTLDVQAGTQSVLSQTFTLQPGQEQAYTATAQATEAGSLSLSATARDASLAQSVKVAVPEVAYDVTAPTLVGRDPFSINVHLNNTGLLPAHLTVAVAGETKSIDLAPGEQLTDHRSLQIQADTTVAVVIHGDLEASQTLTIHQGERASLTLARTATYVEGPVAVPYTVTSTGELPTTLPVHFTVAGQSAERSYTLLPGATLDDSVTFTLTEGEYLLMWETPTEQGQRQLTVRRPLLNHLDMQATIRDRIPGTADLPIALTNTGENHLDGQVRIVTPWSTATLPFALDPGEKANLTGVLDSAGAAGPGTYPVVVEAVSGEQSLAQVEKAVTLTTSLDLQAETPAEVGVGTTATFTGHVTNTGDLAVDTWVTLNLPGIVRRQERVHLTPGQTAVVPLAADIPPDLATSEQRGTLESEGVTAPFTYQVMGFAGTLEAQFDHPFYQPGETATLMVTGHTLAPEGSLEGMTIRVSGAGIDDARSFPAGMEPTFKFDVPAGDKDALLSYGLYLESGRSLYINTIRLRTATGNATLFTEQSVYRPGDIVSMTVITREAGRLTVAGPGYQSAEDVPADTLHLAFRLPDPMVRGTYEIVYALNGQEQRYRFEVDAPGAAVKSVQMNAASYHPGDPVGANLTVEASANLAGTTVEWWVTSPTGKELLRSTLAQDLPVGRSIVTLPNQPLNTNAAGGHDLHYRLLGNGLTLAEGRQRFDVDGTTLLGIAPRTSPIREGQDVQVDVAVVGTGTSRIALLMDGRPVASQDVALNGYSVVTFAAGKPTAGDHLLEARIDQPLVSRAQGQVRVLPLPTVEIQISGYQNQAEWYRQNPVISLVPSEPGAKVYYSWNSGTPALYYDQPITVPADGTRTLQAYAEIDGATGPTASRSFTIDRKPPEIVITAPLAKEYVHSDMLQPQITVTDATSGVEQRTLKVQLDGQPLNPQVPIDLFSLELGNHTLRVEVTDLAGNVAVKEVIFRVIATIASTGGDAGRMFDMGWIDLDGILHSLQVKLDAAQAAVDRGQPDVAINNLESFINEAEAQRGQHLTPAASDHLIKDANWIIASLR
jgi:hypothetical protein